MTDLDIDTGTLQSFDPATYTANVQPDGSLVTFLRGIPVSRHLLTGLLMPNAKVQLLSLDINNPQDTWVIGVQASGSPLGITPNTVACRVFRSSNQSIPNNAQTAISFDTLDIDTGGGAGGQPAMWVVGDPTHITLRIPGLYSAFANVEFDTNANGERTIGILNTAPNKFIGIGELPPVNGDSTNIFAVTGPFQVTVQTSLQLFVYQNSGGALNVDTSRDYTPFMSVHQVV